MLQLELSSTSISRVNIGSLEVGIVDEDILSS